MVSFILYPVALPYLSQSLAEERMEQYFLAGKQFRKSKAWFLLVADRVIPFNLYPVALPYLSHPFAEDRVE